MAKFSPVPPYVLPGTTVADMAAAEAEYARLQQNPAYDMTKGPRRAAVHAKFQSGIPLTPLEAVEFKSIVPKNHMLGVEAMASAAAEHKKRMDDARIEWERQERQRRDAEAKRHRDFMTITDPREAQASLSPADYQAWCQLPHAQKAIAALYG